MFGKKEKKVKKAPKKVRVFQGEKLLYEGKLEELPLKEEIILAKSEEFFHDPNPCYIHRGAVSIRLYAELEMAIAKSDWDLWNRYVNMEETDRVAALEE